LAHSSSAFVLGYRPELDGLRGISILLVIIHHANFIVTRWPYRMLPGGFIGVDIFFVLSGFLITSLITAEHEKTGRLSLKNFYMRRALRLFPAVGSVLIATLIAVMVFGADALDLNLIRVASIFAYFTNWLRAYETPSRWFLAHFWSLAIEEQFYLVWPALLVLLLRVQRRRALIIVGALLLLSAFEVPLLFSVGYSTPRLYAGSDTRGQALLIGCLLALMLRWGVLPRFLTNNKNVIALARSGTILLITAAVAVSDISALLYYGGLTVIAASAAMVLLQAVLIPQSRAGQVLRNPVLLWFGRRSYGLYIWHWPVYWIAAMLSQSWLTIPCAVFASLLVARLSYRYIEQPFLRQKRRLSSA
jgi:peptidoglycan/LPS O-acetylase OafA/YrhL